MAQEHAREESFGISQFLIRFVVSAVVLAITAFFTPGFTISGLWPLLISAVVISLLDYLLVKLLGINATPFGRGITGFILAAVVIYVTQFFVSGFEVTILGALLGALVYGLVDLIIPGKAM